MTNYAKTQEVIEKAGLVYNMSAEELKEEKWFETVKNPRTEDFFQWSHLKQVGIDPPDPEAAKRRYPIKTVNTCSAAVSGSLQDHIGGTSCS